MYFANFLHFYFAPQDSRAYSEGELRQEKKGEKG